MKKTGIKVCYYVNIFSFVITVLFWALVSVKLFSKSSPEMNISNEMLGSTMGFMISDIIALLVLAISIAGFKKMKFWGWFSAQLAYILWIYSVLNMWVRDLYIGNIVPGIFIFTPFALFSIWAIFYLWGVRKEFND